MKTCQRCLQPQKRKSEHGQYICPLEPRTRSALTIKHSYLNYAFATKDKDTLQATMKDGTVNKEFVEAYGTKMLSKELKVPGEAIRRQAEKPTMTLNEIRERYGKTAN